VRTPRCRATTASESPTASESKTASPTPTATATVPPEAGPNLTIGFVPGDGASVSTGSTLPVTLQITNFGDTTLTNVVVTPAYTVTGTAPVLTCGLVASDGTSTPVSIADGTLTLDPGQTVVCTGSYTVVDGDAGTTLGFSATGSGSAMVNGTAVQVPAKVASAAVAQLVPSVQQQVAANGPTPTQAPTTSASAKAPTGGSVAGGSGALGLGAAGLALLGLLGAAVVLRRRGVAESR
jgi:hypothetical protein